MSETKSAFERGNDAAMRIGEYEGTKSVPKCPYPLSSTEAVDWEQGFDFGLDWLIRDGDE